MAEQEAKALDHTNKGYSQAKIVEAWHSTYIRPLGQYQSYLQLFESAAHSIRNQDTTFGFGI
jgi:hypothetical protein